jgi:ribosomal protein S18 acetylase RimI-like enzyme
VYQLRSFRNSDPPHLAEIWRSQPPQRGILQPISAPMLEFGVFSKAHFDRNGLIVACKDDQIVGFVHAGFGPNEDGTGLDKAMGTTHMLMVRAGYETEELTDALLGASEEYLKNSGSTVIYAGGVKPLNSFYLGLYGGSEIPGVLGTNTVLREACLRRGYVEAAQVSILQCDLARYRPSVSRKVRQVGRASRFEEIVDPRSTTWWEACVWGAQQRDRFSLMDKASGERLAVASFWDVQPLSASWGICTAGLFDLYVEPEHRREGYASFLLGEAFRLLRRRGVVTVEAQTMLTNEPALAFYQSLGFVEVDRGYVFRKSSSMQHTPHTAAALSAASW